MSEWEMTTPIALVIFNRPTTTRAVLEQIRKVKPNELYVIADGPREDHPSDEKKVAETRRIIEEIDWDCEVQRNYSDENQGIGQRIPTGLDWVFDKVEEAVILEDDCVPDPSFFRFAQTMLDVYRSDERIMDISGSNHLGQWKSDEQDYHYSIYGGIWGWATWRRSWELYDPDMTLWGDPNMRKRVRDYVADDKQFEYVRRIYQWTYEGKIETWDYQWGFTRSINWGLSIVPSKNLISNVGFGEDATNTEAVDSPIANIPRHSMEFPVTMNEYVAVDRDYDRRYYKISNSLWERNRLLRLLRNIYFNLHQYP